MGLWFPIVKLLDYQADWAALEENDNPFSVVVMAHLQALRTRGEPGRRLVGKLRLMRGLYERGYERQEVLSLFRFIDWVLTLPEELVEQFDQAITSYEEARRMEYVTSIERRAIERGIEQGIGQGEVKATRSMVLTVLETRFGDVPTEVATAVQGITELAQLEALLKEAVMVETMAEFQEHLPTTPNSSAKAQT